MPIVPGANANPFPTVGEIMDGARSAVNDMHNDTSGDLLTTEAPSSQTYLTRAWRWIQDKCAAAKIECNSNEFAIIGFPARFTNDPINQCWITWQGCSDGVNQYDQPALQQGLISPRDIWRRPSGNVGSAFSCMSQGVNGLPRFIDPTKWQWRANGLYFYGDQYPQDLIISGNFYFGNLDIKQADSEVPIYGCNECLSNRVAFYFTNARMPGSAGANSLQSLSETAFADSLVPPASDRNQRKNARRRPYSNRGYCGANPFPYQVMP